MGTGSDMGTGAATGSDMAGTGSGTGAGTGSGEAPGGNLMSKKGGNCPNLVAGAITKVTIDQKKFQATVEITSTDKNAIATVQSRAKAFKDRKKEATPGGTHDSKGSKNGEEGMCAVAQPPFEVASVKDLKNGTSMVLKLDAATTKDPAASAKAFDAIQARADSGAAWVKDNLKLEPGGQGGTGAGSGKHGRDHSGKGDAKGMEGGGGGKGTGGGGGKGTGGGKGGGGGSGSGSATP